MPAHKSCYCTVFLGLREQFFSVTDLFSSKYNHWLSSFIYCAVISTGDFLNFEGHDKNLKFSEHKLAATVRKEAILFVLPSKLKPFCKGVLISQPNQLISYIFKVCNPNFKIPF